MKKTRNEIEQILLSAPVKKDLFESFTMLAVVRPTKAKGKIEIYVENFDRWIQLPISDIVDLEVVDTVSIDDQPYKFVHLEIGIPKTDNTYHILLKDALTSIGGLVNSKGTTKCGCSCGGDSPNDENMVQIQKRAGNRPTKISGSGSANCYSCKFLFGRWYCITWTSCLEALK